MYYNVNAPRSYAGDCPYNHGTFYLQHLDHYGFQHEVLIDHKTGVTVFAANGLGRKTYHLDADTIKTVIVQLMSMTRIAKQQGDDDAYWLTNFLSRALWAFDAAALRQMAKTW